MVKGRHLEGCERRTGDRRRLSGAGSEGANDVAFRRRVRTGPPKACCEPSSRGLRGREPLSESDAAADASIGRVRKGASIRRAFSFLQGLLPRLQHFSAPGSPRRALEPLNARPSRRRPRARAHAVFIKVPRRLGRPATLDAARLVRSACGRGDESGRAKPFSSAARARRHWRRSPGGTQAFMLNAQTQLPAARTRRGHSTPSGSRATCAALRRCPPARSLSTRGGVVVACTAPRRRAG